MSIEAMWFVLMMWNIHIGQLFITVGWQKDVHDKLKEEIVALKQMDASTN